MHYIVGSGFRAQEDGGLIRLYHKATIEDQDVGVALSKTETVNDEPRATPIRARTIPPTGRYRADDAQQLHFDSRGRLLVATKKKTKFLIGFGLLVTALVSYAAFIYNTAW